MTKEVKAKLTLEDAASGTLDRIKSGFGELYSSETKAQGGMDVLKQTMSTMAGVYLPQLTRATIAWGKSFNTQMSSSSGVCSASFESFSPFGPFSPLLFFW